jgi:plastocyanin
MKPRALIIPAVVAGAVAVIALLAAGSPTSPATNSGARAQTGGSVASGHVVVVIQNYAYHPDTLTVRAGTTISVVNRDMTQHTLTANDGAFTTGTIQPGQTKQLTLRRTGTFPYHCLFHAFMTGTLKVVG